jgi:LuxR family maltose regulon positive regulatory protein
MAEAGAHILPNSTTGFVCLILVEARVARAQGERDEALAHIRRARFMAQQRRMAWANAVIDSLEAQIQIAAGDLDAAERLIQRAAAAPEPAELRFFPPAFVYAGEHCAAAPLQLRLARGTAQADLAALRDLLGDLEDRIVAADGQGFCWLQIKLRALQAMAYAALGHQAQGLEVLGRALALAAPEGYQEVLLEEGPPVEALIERGLAAGAWLADDAGVGDYLARLRGRFDPQPRPAAPEPPPPAPALPEPLSARELEVLRLMAEGHGNAEIAAAMVIAMSTVKSHVNNIFGKLGVATRTQAIARARRLNLF